VIYDSGVKLPQKSFKPNSLRNRAVRRDNTQSAKATIHPSAECKNDSAIVCHVLTNDLSDGGIGILSPRPISEGQRIELELLDGRRFFAQVQWITRTNDGMYAIGCKFLDEHGAAVEGDAKNENPREPMAGLE
jgi:hypothetical protein